MIPKLKSDKETYGCQIYYNIFGLDTIEEGFTNMFEIISCQTNLYQYVYLHFL